MKYPLALTLAPIATASVAGIAVICVSLSPAFAEGARQSPSLERAVKIEAAVKLCKLFSSIPKSSPKFNQIAARAAALYSNAAIELNVPLPEAVKLSESRAAVLIDDIQNTDRVADFCRDMKKEEE